MTSDRVAAAAKVIDTEHVKSMRNMRLPNPSKLARALDAAGLLAPEMQEEWGVESREHFGGMVTDWHLTIPFHKGRNWESAKAFIEGRKNNPGFEYRLVRRYVTEVIVDE